MNQISVAYRFGESPSFSVVPSCELYPKSELVGLHDTDSLGALPEPTCSGYESQDLLAMMMASVERMSQLSEGETELRIQTNQAKLDKVMEDFLSKVADSVKQMKQARSKSWFRKAIDSVVQACGKVIGAIVDFAKDTVEAPFDIGKSLVNGQGNVIASFKQAFVEHLKDLVTNGSAAKSVEKFTQGVAAFCLDLGEIVQEAFVQMAENIGSGKSLDVALLKDKLSELYQSLSSNILRNEGFWDVMEVVAIAAVVAASVMSGGAAGAVALALVIALQVDKKTGIIGQLAGKDAAPWIRGAMALGAMICTAGAGGQYAQVIQSIQSACAVVSGAGAIEQGRYQYVQAKQAKLEAFREAELQQRAERIQTLRTMIGELISELDDKSQTRTENYNTFQSLVQLQANSLSAAMIKG